MRKKVDEMEGVDAYDYLERKARSNLWRIEAAVNLIFEATGDRLSAITQILCDAEKAQRRLTEQLSRLNEKVTREHFRKQKEGGSDAKA